MHRLLLKLTATLLLHLLSCAAAAAAADTERRIVDLTHAYDTSTVYWPTAPGFELTVDADGITDQGYYYAANTFRSAEHGGTHLDAPVHFAEGRHSTEQIPLRRLIGPGAMIDVSTACAADRDYQIVVADILAWERSQGRTVDDRIVLFRTGFAARWPDLERYLGTAERGDDAVAKLHFPGLSAAAARWLVESRRVRAVGIDTASIDPGQSRVFEAHRILFAENIPAFENVADLSALPAAGFQVVALPMKIAGGSGGPLRIVALLPDG